MSDNQFDPWECQEPKSAQVPEGWYTARFKGADEYTLPTTGEAKWRFSWIVKTGEHAGKEASALTERGFNPNTLAGRLIGELLGKPIKGGDHVKALVDACKGKEYLVVVQRGPKNGKPGVKSVKSVSQPPDM